MWFNQVLNFFFRTEEKAHALKLYEESVAQARNPQLYQNCGLIDDIQTRFEFVTAHLWLVMRSMGAQNKRSLQRELAACFFSDMDASLREAGEGDLAVPKRIKTFAQAFYGRLAAYDKGLAQNRLGEALKSNLGGNDTLATYFAAQITHFDQNLEGVNLFKRG